MTTSCQASSKTVGQVVNLSATPSGGTPPYTVKLYKDSTLLWSQAAVTENQAVSVQYTTISADIGAHNFKAQATDSCSTPQTSTMEFCPVTVTAATTPGWNCVSPGNCVYSSTGGAYSTQQACLTACPATCGACSPTCPSGTCPTGQQCSGGVCVTPTSPLACTPACKSTEICILGTCVQKKYLTYGAIGLGALLIISILK